MQFKKEKNSLIKNILLILVIFSLISLFFTFISSFVYQTNKIGLSQLVKEIKAGKVKKIIVSDSSLTVIYKDNSRAFCQKEPNIAFSKSLFDFGVSKEELGNIDVEFHPQGNNSWLFPLLLTILPFLFILLFFYFLFRQAKTGASQIFDFTRVKPKLLGPGKEMKEKITFNEVGGLKEAKEELQEIVDFLKHPKKYLRMGARIPRGVLLMGPPGTGKTLLAKAIASTAEVPFFSISASEMIELFVGVGSARIRNLFDQARRAGRAIIFIDEIDSIGKIRGIGVTGGHEEREQTLNQLLSEMDGIKREENLIVLGATNRPEYLDPALLRPGRFDRRIVLDLPDIKEREEILEIHCRGKPLAEHVDLREIAERTPGFSGADLANVVNEAAILAARREKTEISQRELIESIEKVLLGPERKSHILSKREKEISAYHEAGHALVCSSLPNTEPIRKISIISRGQAAGYTLRMPKEERKIKTKSEFLADMATLLGGYCAEKIKFKEISTGASNDLERATFLAKKLVTEYGMSSLGPISYGEKERLGFLRYEIEHRDYSEEVARKIDREIEKLIRQAEETAKKILLKKKRLLDRIAQRLIEKETIEKEEFEALIRKKEKEIEKKEKKKEKKRKTKEVIKINLKEVK